MVLAVQSKAGAGSKHPLLLPPLPFMLLLLPFMLLRPHLCSFRLHFSSVSARFCSRCSHLCSLRPPMDADNAAVDGCRARAATVDFSCNDDMVTLDAADATRATFASLLQTGWGVSATHEHFSGKKNKMEVRA
eukprot:595977-Rhodomonas_salina.1